MNIIENKQLPAPALGIIAVVGWTAVIYLAYVGAHDAVMRTFFSVYTPASALAPAHLECWFGENSLDYNDGALDAPGPDEQAWTPYLGTYRLEQ